MKRRLILFSGGVESTAMLTIRDPQDVVITIVDGEPDHHDVEAVEKIAGLFRVKLERAAIFVPFQRSRSLPVYQLVPFLSVASVWVARDPSIYEVWYGMEKGEPTPASADAYHRSVVSWNFLHPGVPVVSPLHHETHQAQWERIPTHIRPHVRNCGAGGECGWCSKCKKLKALPNSFWCEKSDSRP